MTFEDLHTPCYIILQEEYEKNITDFMDAFQSRWCSEVKFGYSVKTNHLPHMLKTAQKKGWLAEVVSCDEYQFVESLGYDKTNIIYNGPQKGNTILDATISGSIVNIDNLEELDLICDKLSEPNKSNICVGIRVNFDLESLCPGETSTGNSVGRFGICYENGDLEKAIHKLHNNNITLSGLHMHSSSTSRSLAIYEAICKKTLEIIRNYNLYNIKYVDLGGGFFGGSYFPDKPTYIQYAKCITESLKELDQKGISLILEPGAAILATSMDYLTSVINIREIRGKRIITVDGSLIHINPMMKPHESPCTLINPGNSTNRSQIIGGSTCMENDRFLPRNLNKGLEKNSALRFHCCGAYMSTHNSSFINCAPYIYKFENDDYTLIREKKLESMLLY